MQNKNQNFVFSDSQGADEKNRSKKSNHHDHQTVISAMEVSMKIF